MTTHQNQEQPEPKKLGSSKKPSLFKKQTEPIFMSPLDDPVLNAIFDNVKNAGLAAQSLVGSILQEDGHRIKRVISVVPQRYYKIYPNKRGCRVDILIETEDNETIIAEVQTSKEPMGTRNLFEAAQVILANSPKGSDVWKHNKIMPRIYIINILDFILRDNHDDAIQPVGILYAKGTSDVAIPNLRIYNVQLPLFRTKEHDFDKPLDAWLYILDTAHQKEIPVGEVIAMNEKLKKTVEADLGLKQFTRQYARASASAKTQKEWAMYCSEKMRMKGMLWAAESTGEARGRTEGQLQDIRNLMVSMNMSAEQAMKALLIPQSEISHYTTLLQDSNGDIR
ncbi:MAG: Rpn family recombination-promoting nuclease/putative transposase [Lachnospiraceae bacterium]|jgi:predicted transposase/invertase (TIGR01784 family)|nr:Rpn family recombination-promoting nuclease/putative transposase [Lachnospiraceae bacterium]